MGCIIGKLATTAPGSSLFFPAAATSVGGGDDREVQLQAPRPEHIAAVKKDASGWPLWLSEAAGDALRGWAPRGADAFQKLEKIGSGTYSNVYKAIEVASGRVVALKKVRVDGVGEAESARFMAREIALLRRLGDHPNVVRLDGLVTSRLNTAPSLYLVFEYMEHDLTGLTACAAASARRLSLPQVKCYMKQLLSGIEHCHNNGVLHRDIKTSNLLVSSDGILKIADFGLATSYDPEDARPMTSQVITLWYRPPELLLGSTHYGVGVDLWSVGCVLAELLLGEPVFPGRTEVEQLHKVFKLCGTPSEDYWEKMKLAHPTFGPYERCLAEKFKDVAPSTLSLLETLLSIDPDMRGTATDALNSEFFRTEPYACEPSSLPRYPPCKERDVKLKYEKHKRKSRVNGSVERHRNRQHASQNPGRRVFTPDANNKPQANPKVPRLVTSTSTTKLERFPPPHLDASIGYSLDASVDDGATEEFFSSSAAELKKMPSLIFGHVKSYLASSPRKGVHKAKPSLNMAMAPPTLLIGAFRPYSFGRSMEVRRKNREQFRSKGRNAVGAVK
ncbi:probable serine/threonine-protein kinase At1g54610 [Zea mays]|uniref:[RNA-polymerase]-subunit kinase n=2 Tax=Zea mays TaxID=4577 RepID=A0A1D6G558_MAIZE|nr:probable serine/threonine-protein kinase At1g54610 [Zea mays]AQK98418.1 hypothetical protein ZEAMMB73_Zm00001d011967 [Zea mays]|eukprot:XP_008656910.1 probable serine/threonine-protein kinase At1g54610 [Zea mays]